MTDASFQRSEWPFAAVVLGVSPRIDCLAVTGSGHPCTNQAHSGTLCGLHEGTDDPGIPPGAHQWARIDHNGHPVGEERTVAVCVRCEAVWDGYTPPQAVPCPGCDADIGQRCRKPKTNAGTPAPIPPHAARRERAREVVDGFEACPESPVALVDDGRGQERLVTDGGADHPYAPSDLATLTVRRNERGGRIRLPTRVVAAIVDEGEQLPDRVALREPDTDPHLVAGTDGVVDYSVGPDGRVNLGHGLLEALGLERGDWVRLTEHADGVAIEPRDRPEEVPDERDGDVDVPHDLDPDRQVVVGYGIGYGPDTPYHTVDCGYRDELEATRERRLGSLDSRFRECEYCRDQRRGEADDAEARELLADGGEGRAPEDVHGETVSGADPRDDDPVVRAEDRLRLALDDVEWTPQQTREVVTALATVAANRGVTDATIASALDGEADHRRERAARADGGRPHPSELSAFQIACLRCIGADEPRYGLAIKRALEEYYGQKVNHGRLYPNLDELVVHGLVEKGQRDRRTNEYSLTAAGRDLLVERSEWLTDPVDVDERAPRPDGGEEP